MRMDSAPLAGAVIAGVLALQLPAAYTWITSIAGFTLLLMLNRPSVASATYGRFLRVRGSSRS